MYFSLHFLCLTGVLIVYSNVRKLVGELNVDFHTRHTQRYAESSRLVTNSSRPEEDED